MTIDQAFDRTVAYYDDWMKRVLPGYDDIFAVATQVAPFESDAPIRVLDLGAGTGLFSQHVLQKHPNATFVLYDVAAKMLEVAKQRFAEQAGRFEFAIEDYRNLQAIEEFDLVISSLSIHHLSDEEKRKLCRQIYAALKENGVFVNIDQIKGETTYLRNLYWELWLRRTRANGAPEEQILESIERRTAYDQDALLADQLQWLQEAGFENVDCVYRHTFVGVFLAMRGTQR
ncbi:MAG: class I SAM-dependent methyltransferase [Anaerolineae bacterium]|nr:class I SAM-dependent methyltransferase [Anaerolineae bacterium]